MDRKDLIRLTRQDGNLNPRVNFRVITEDGKVTDIEMPLIDLAKLMFGEMVKCNVQCRDNPCPDCDRKSEYINTRDGIENFRCNNDDCSTLYWEKTNG